MTKVTNSSKSKIMRKAWEIFKNGTRNFSEALKEAWRVAKAIANGTVTFWKLSDDSITTRRISSLSNFNYTPKGNGKSTANTFKFVDLDKLEATGNVAASIISFYGFQVISEL